MENLSGESYHHDNNEILVTVKADEIYSMSVYNTSYKIIDASEIGEPVSTAAASDDNSWVCMGDDEPLNKVEAPAEKSDHEEPCIQKEEKANINNCGDRGIEHEHTGSLKIELSEIFLAVKTEGELLVDHVQNNSQQQQIETQEESFLCTKNTKTKKQKRKKSPSVKDHCDICGKSYKNSYYLAEHKKRHETEKSLKCNLCGKDFKMIQDLKSHIKSHLKERPFSCALCGKCFTRASLLNYHVRIHTGERPYVCDICQMTFSRPFGLSQHKARAHLVNNGRVFRCDESNCDKAFVTLREKDAHVYRMHSGQKLFPCRFCGKAFGIKTSLSYHLQQHHSEERPHKCPTANCEKSFKTVANLIAHVKFSHKDFTYKCPHCPLEFKMRSQLNRHLKVAKSHVRPVK